MINMSENQCLFVVGFFCFLLFFCCFYLLFFVVGFF